MQDNNRISLELLNHQGFTNMLEEGLLEVDMSLNLTIKNVPHLLQWVNGTNPFASLGKWIYNCAKLSFLAKLLLSPACEFSIRNLFGIG